MKHPAASSGVSSSLLGRHSVLDGTCPVLDTVESSLLFWIPACAGMTNSQQAAGNAPKGIQCSMINVKCSMISVFPYFPFITSRKMLGSKKFLGSTQSPIDPISTKTFST